MVIGSWGRHTSMLDCTYDGAGISGDQIIQASTQVRSTGDDEYASGYEDINITLPL